jgi:multiple sugar transport system ATP-binding protein
VAAVTLRRLSKRYRSDGRAALDGVSLDIRDGELFVVVGPSGSGKTTLLRCIAGLEEMAAGEVLLGARDVTRAPPAERDVAMVFQTQALYPHLTVRGNIAFGLEVRRMPRPDIARRVETAAKRLRLDAVLDRYPAQLSGGERQRVALGRAMVREPQAFLLDEPLASLEPTLRDALRAELLELHRALGATMLYVTHDQAEAMALGQRIAILDEGRVRQLGTPAELYQRPANVFVARFLGSPGMNILTGHAQGAHAGAGEAAGAGAGMGVVDCGAWSVPVPLERYEGEIHLGVRPEHISLVAPDQGLGPADVRVVEPLGADTLVRLDAGDQKLVARVPGIPDWRPGDRVGVKLDRQKLHLFDAAGERIR